MSVKVREGIDYKILPDDYRAEFNKHVKPVKTVKENVNGQVQIVKYYRCMYCGHLIPHYEMDVDHIIPKTRLYAGILWNPNKAWNLGPSCKSCNISKSNYIDERVIIGFKNKLLGRYGLSAGENAAYTSGDDNSQRWKIYCIMGLVFTLSIFAPVILLTLKGLEYILVYGSKLLRWLGKHLFTSVKNVLKYIIKHPIKTVKTVVAVTAVVVASNIVMAYFGISFDSALQMVGKWLSSSASTLFTRFWG